MRSEFSRVAGMDALILLDVNNAREISDAVKSLGLLGKSVDRIVAEFSYMNFDYEIHPYYKRFPEEILDYIYRKAVSGLGIIIYIKNGNVYTDFEGYTVLLKDVKCRMVDIRFTEGRSL